jgi:putative Holliday junction resolvase
MPIVDIHTLPALLPIRARVLGLDLGDKTLGMAVSDRDRRVASPVDTLRRTKFTRDAEALTNVCLDREIKALILGLPVNMKGEEGRRCQATRQFARNLIEKAGYTLPIAFWDERLSTAAVERVLIDEADMRRHERGQVVDKMAAAYILQGALDALGQDRASGGDADE